MIDMTALGARVEQAVREIHAKRQASPDPNFEARPAVRAQLAEQHRVLSERHHAIGTGYTSVLRSTARITRWQDARALTVRALVDFAAAAAAAPEGDVKRAYEHGSRCLTGEAGDSGTPGAVTMWCRENGVERLTSLPTIDEQLAQAEHDIAPYLTRLQTELIAWDAERPAPEAAGTATVRVRGTSTVVLPSVESHGEAVVRERTHE